MSDLILWNQVDILQKHFKKDHVHMRIWTRFYGISFYSLGLCLTEGVDDDRLAPSCGADNHSGVPGQHRLVHLDNFVHLSTKRRVRQLRARRALTLFNNVPLRTRKALAQYKVYGNLAVGPIWFLTEHR